MSNLQNLKKTFITEPLLKRFLSFVKIWTTSDSSVADKGIQPSTERQRDFAQLLQNELRLMGVSDLTLTAESYLCARIPASKGYENCPSVCFLAHLDTVEEVSGKDVKPLVFSNYDGNPITLKNDVSLDPDEDSALAQCAGDTIIT
ncbi:MAG: peptidase T, partial [Spirochaetaceae bacterium]|nr:peptidase T [Spirochaetaceae bacterium]